MGHVDWKDRFAPYEKWLELHEELRLSNYTTGYCHGVYDIIGPGHLYHLNWARSKCEALFVSVTCDVAVTKDPARPILPADDRALHLAALVFITSSTICPYPSADKVIEEMKPSFYIKGADTLKNPSYSFSDEVTACFKAGTRLLFSPSTKEFHTTDILKNFT